MTLTPEIYASLNGGVNAGRDAALAGEEGMAQAGHG